MLDIVESSPEIQGEYYLIIPGMFDGVYDLAV